MTFFVGQKVVCVDDSTVSFLGWCSGAEVTQGKIYVVRGIAVTALGVPGLRLIERINRGNSGLADYPYRATRFRPVTERKTDISIFSEMLTPNGVKQNERV